MSATTPRLTRREESVAPKICALALRARPIRRNTRQRMANVIHKTRPLTSAAMTAAMIKFMEVFFVSLFHRFLRIFLATIKRVDLAAAGKTFGRESHSYRAE